MGREKSFQVVKRRRRLAQHQDVGGGVVDWHTALGRLVVRLEFGYRRSCCSRAVGGMTVAVNVLEALGAGCGTFTGCVIVVISIIPAGGRPLGSLGGRRRGPRCRGASRSAIGRWQVPDLLDRLPAKI